MVQITVYIVNNADDGFRTKDSAGYPPVYSFDNALTYVTVGRNKVVVGGETFADETHDLYLRFIASIPKGSTINSAVLHVIAAVSNSNATVKSGTKGSLEADPSAPTSWDDYESKAKTSAYVLHTFPAWVAGTEYVFPDFASVVQEIVDAYNIEALTLYMLDDASTAAANRTRQAASLEHASYSQAWIVIDYTPPVGIVSKRLLVGAGV